MVTRKKSQRKSTSSDSLDPATEYAQGVVSGKYPAGPHVRDACQRHLRDLKEGPKRGLRWDTEAAAHVYGFFSDVLCLSGGEHDGQPFILQPWQKFIIGSLFGWKGPDGYRRFRKAFIETGKGSGKSPMAAGIGLYMMVADKEPGAEVYAAACDKDQASVLFRDAVGMVKQSKALSKRLRFSGGEGREYNIAYLEKSSFFRPISSEASGRGKSGFRPHCVLLDEIHEHPTSAMIDFMAKGTKGRRQALIFMITNSGSDRQSVCFAYHEYGTKVCADTLQDDEFFAYICAVDEDDEPLNDESCWEKANPNLGVTFPYKYLRGEVHQARGMPSAQNITLRLNFCVWTDAADAWITAAMWKSCERTMDLESFKGRECYGGIDLGSINDLTAAAQVWNAPDGSYDAVVTLWTPKETLKKREERDRVYYSQWVREGHLLTTPSVAMDYSYIAPQLAEMNANSPFIQVGYDRWRIKDLTRELDNIGADLPLVEFGQGYQDMGPALDAIEKAIANGRLRVHENPVLRWNVASAVTESSPAGDRKFIKRKSTGRIDGLVALTMAVRLAEMKNTPAVPSIFIGD